MAAIKNASSELSRARNISQTLGTRRAASYLRNRGYSLECALWVLARSSVANPVSEQLHVSKQELVYMNLTKN